MGFTEVVGEVKAMFFAQGARFLGKVFFLFLRSEIGGELFVAVFEASIED